MQPKTEKDAAASGDAWTIGRLLQWTTDFLKQRGAENPRLDAEVLLAEARGCSRIELYTAFNETPDEATRAAFRELVRRRGEGAPVAYLVGRREFYSLPFRVTPDVLIPRPETEFLVVRMLDLIDEMLATKEAVDVADVGVGSGVIAICAALRSPKVRVKAFDISSAAIVVAKENAATHGVADRIEFFESDLLAAAPAGATFDIIASNPPYISTSEMESLPPDVREYEPRQALEAGPAGDEIVNRLISEAEQRLNPRGWLLVEISPMIHDRVHARLDADAAWEVAPTVRDLAGHARVIVARRTSSS